MAILLAVLLAFGGAAEYASEVAAAQAPIEGGADCILGDCGFADEKLDGNRALVTETQALLHGLAEIGAPPKRLRRLVKITRRQAHDQLEASAAWLDCLTKNSGQIIPCEDSGDWEELQVAAAGWERVFARWEPYL